MIFSILIAVPMTIYFVQLCDAFFDFEMDEIESKRQLFKRLIPFYDIIKRFRELD